MCVSVRVCVRACVCSVCAVRMHACVREMVWMLLGRLWRRIYDFTCLLDRAEVGEVELKHIAPALDKVGRLFVVQAPACRGVHGVFVVVVVVVVVW